MQTATRSTHQHTHKHKHTQSQIHTRKHTHTFSVSYSLMHLHMHSQQMYNTSIVVPKPTPQPPPAHTAFKHRTCARHCSPVQVRTSRIRWLSCNGSRPLLGWPERTSVTPAPPQHQRPCHSSKHYVTNTCSATPIRHLHALYVCNGVCICVFACVCSCVGQRAGVTQRVHVKHSHSVAQGSKIKPPQESTPPAQPKRSVSSSDHINAVYMYLCV